MADRMSDEELKEYFEGMDEINSYNLAVAEMRRAREAEMKWKDRACRNLQEPKRLTKLCEKYEKENAELKAERDRFFDMVVSGRI